MVITRSQTRRLQEHQTLIYRGFVLSKPENKARVDCFYQAIKTGLQCGHETLLNRFWRYGMDTIHIQNFDIIPIQERISLLKTHMDDKHLWKEFDRECKDFVEPYKNIIQTNEAQANLARGLNNWKWEDLSQNGETITIDITPLEKYKYWMTLSDDLLISIMKTLLEEANQLRDSLQKAVIYRDMFKVCIIAKKLITNPYTAKFKGLKFYYMLISKILEFISKGVEYALYSLAVFYPEMVCDEVRPHFDKNAQYYKKISLVVSESDPIYGNIKKNYYQYY